MTITWNRDCREYKGVQPCDILTAEGYTSCTECEFYDPKGTRILIIKLGAAGDVLRTTPLLHAIKKAHPQSHITWVTKEPNNELLKENHLIDRTLTLTSNTLFQLQHEAFDIMYNFEIDLPATGIATKINAAKKYGYYLAEDGHPAPYTPAGQYYLDRANSNKINKQNKKTYQELMYTIAELTYEKQDYVLNLTEEEREASKNFRKHYAIGNEQKLIGINIGAGKRWPGKNWGTQNIINLIKNLQQPVILLAGPEEPETLQETIQEKLKSHEWPILKNNQYNSMREYMSIINACDLVLSGDTLTLHIALALKKKTIGLFLCTPPWEVEPYERMIHITSPLLDQHFYEDQTTYNQETIKKLQNSISVETVTEELKKLL